MARGSAITTATTPGVAPLVETKKNIQQTVILLLSVLRKEWSV
jgi:hypothetical protein